MEPSLELVPPLPTLDGQDTVERREAPDCGPIVATGASWVANWLWPQSNSLATRLTYMYMYVLVRNEFPPLSKRQVERIQALDYVDMADQRQEVLDPEPDHRQDVIMPGLAVAIAKRKSVEDITNDVLHHLHSSSGNIRVDCT